MPITVKLSRPLVTHAGEVTELVLRDFTARDAVTVRRSHISIINRTVGEGSAAVSEARFEIDYEISMQYLAMVTGVDRILLDNLPMSDFDACCAALNTQWNGVGK